MSLQKMLAIDASREQIEEWCRREARALPIGAGNLTLCRVLGKYLMYTFSQDLALTPHLAFNGIWEPWVTMAIARHVKPGMRCLDVGACYGYYSLLMADIVGSNGSVMAWEPIWYEMVSTNAQINGLAIDVMPCAMGTGSGEVAFLDSPVNDLALFNAGGASPTNPKDLRNPQSTTLVTVRRPVGQAPYDFIKIDVEGSEADVWDALGATRLVSHELTVCMEFTPKQHQEPRMFLQTIIDDGFELGTVGHDGYPRSCSIEEALVPDTGDFRMLWLTRKS